jgi:hypothetical protein
MVEATHSEDTQRALDLLRESNQDHILAEYEKSPAEV